MRLFVGDRVSVRRDEQEIGARVTKIGLYQPEPESTIPYFLSGVLVRLDNGEEWWISKLAIEWYVRKI